MGAAEKSFVIVGAFLLLVVTGCGKPQGSKRPARTSPSTPQEANATEPRPSRRASIAKLEGWEPEDFFDKPHQLKLCSAISAGDLEDVRDLLDPNYPPNYTGKYGITVLHWAYIANNLEAFELLLEHGANPDRKLTQNVAITKVRPFYAGETILFSSLRHWRREKFCAAALKYTRDPKQRGSYGETLFHVYWTADTGASEQFVQSLIDAGVDLDAKDRYGNPPCSRVLRESWGGANATLCLQLLEAGADPSAKNKDGLDVADQLESLLARNSHFVNNPEPLITWLNENYREIHWIKR